MTIEISEVSSLGGVVDPAARSAAATASAAAATAAGMAVDAKANPTLTATAITNAGGDTVARAAAADAKANPALTQANANAATAAGVVFADGVARANALITRRSGIIASGTDGIRVGSGAAPAGGWNASVGVLSLETINVRRPGVPALRITMTPGSEISARIKVYPRVVSGKLEIWGYLPKITAGTMYFGITKSSDTPAADPPSGTPSNRQRITLDAGKYVPGVYTCIASIDRDGKIYGPGVPDGVGWSTTGTPDSSKIEYLEIFCSCSAAVPADQQYMLVDQVAINGKALPLVILGFDGFELTSHQTVVKPLLDKLGLRGYFAGDGDQISVVRGFLQDRYAQGWDIVNSGMYHTNYSDNPTLLSGQYDQGRALLDAEGFTRARRFFVYPNTARTDATDATLAGKGVVMSRLNGGPPNVISNLGVSNLMGVNTFDCGLRTTATMTGWIDTALACGETLSLLFHTVKDGSAAAIDTEKTAFIAVMKDLAARQDAGLCRIVTPTEFAAYLGISLT